MRFYLFGHSGSRNRGCEAIARTSSMLIKSIGGDPRVVLYSRRPHEERGLAFPHVDEIKTHMAPNASLAFFLSGVSYVLTGRLRTAMYFEPFLRDIARDDVCLSIGGDNYCYERNIKILSPLNALVRAKTDKLALWAASIEPEFLKIPELREDLARFDAITARESITFEALADVGLGARTSLYPDPAFLMGAQSVTLPAAWQTGNTVGVNISPMVFRYAREQNTLSDAAYLLVKHILDTTDASVALIPHVTWSASNDLTTHAAIAKRFEGNARVINIGDGYSAEQLKGIISQCRLFVGARTHATIAAYSTLVPTLVLGYSVKSKGIARDLFGTHEEYVLPVQQLTEAAQLTRAFDALRERERELRDQLTAIMPGYLDKARASSQFFAKLGGR